MTHTLTPEVSALLEKWENLGFITKKQAAEFILANENWNELVKVDFDKRDIQVVNEWRKNAIEVDKSKNKML